MRLVIKVALFVFLVIAGLYCFGVVGHPNAVAYTDGAKLAFQVPQGWCAMDKDDETHTIVVFKETALRPSCLSGSRTEVSIKAVRMSDLSEDDIKFLKTCTAGAEAGTDAFHESEASYCAPKAANGIRETRAYRFLDNERLTITVLSTRETEDRDSQVKRLISLVNSYKLVEDK